MSTSSVTGAAPPLDVDEGRAEGRVLPAVMEYGLQEGGGEAVARLLDGGLEPLHVFQPQVPLFFEQIDHCRHTIGV